MRKKGGAILYVIFLFVISAAIFNFGTKKPINISTNVNFIEKNSISTSGDVIVATTSAVENVPTTKNSELDELSDVEEENFENKSTPLLEDTRDTEELIGKLVHIEEKGVIASISTSSLVVSDVFYPNNDGDLEKSGILYYTNIEREKEGFKLLKENELLDQAALAKLEHMFANEYFEHVAPTGEDVSYWVDNTMYSYIGIGENLAQGGYKDEGSMVQDWMDSPGHRKNIMKESYEEIGIAVKKDYFEGLSLWIGVQIFAIPTSACPEINKELLVSVESFRTLVENMGETIMSLYATISALPQPTTQKEYNEYVAMVNQYNELVAEEKNFNNQLNTVISEYNTQVTEHNQCITTK